MPVRNVGAFCPSRRAVESSPPDRDAQIEGTERVAGCYRPLTLNLAPSISRKQTQVVVRRGIRSSMLGIVVNLLLATGKCVAGTLGHSFALISDGIESLTDVVSSSIVVAGLFWAARPPDKDHPYGHGKAEPIAAVVVSLSLLAAALFIAFESIMEIRTP